MLFYQESGYFKSILNNSLFKGYIFFETQENAIWRE